MSERTSAVAFQTPEMAVLAAAVDAHARLQARTDAAARRVQKALRAVAKAEGGGYVPPARKSDLLTGKAGRCQSPAPDRGERRRRKQ